MLRLTRRFALTAAIALTGFSAAPVTAQTLDLTITVPSNPGGGFDQTARAIQSAMEAEEMAGRIQVVNTPGGGGSIGLAQFAVSKAKDPNAILIGGLSLVSAVEINQTPVTLEEVRPLARLTGEYFVLAVPTASDIKTVEELIEKFKADPRSVSWGAGSAGSGDHLLIGMFAKAAGVAPEGINYIAHSGGGEALSELIGGHVTVGVSGYGEFESQVTAGNLRLLAISSAERQPGIDVPTLKESGIDVELVNWRGIFAPAKISDEQFATLAAATDKLVQSESWKQQLEKYQWQDLYLAPADFEAYLTKNHAEVTTVLSDIGLVK